MGVDIRKIVTDKIIEGLEKGKVPWVKPWNAEEPQNYDSRKAYRGMNWLILSWVAQDNNWSPYWLTFKSLAEHGFRLKPEQHGTPICFFKFVEVEDKDTGEKDTFPMLRYYTVFNLSQCDGVTIPESKKIDFVPDEKAESIIAGYIGKPEIVFGSTGASYAPKSDRVNMPNKTKFTSIPSYYSTLFHELGHSTGHPTRLNRPGVADFDHFGSEKYAKEELVAELTSAFLCAESGMQLVIENQTAYIQSWLTALKDDRQLLLSASGQAQRAADHILGTTFEKKGE